MGKLGIDKVDKFYCLLNLFYRKLSDKHWLLDFCFFAASDDSDSEAKTKFIEMLQTSVSDSDGSLMDTAGFEFLSV